MNRNRPPPQQLSFPFEKLGHHNILRFQLLRNRLQQGGLPQAGPPAGYPFRDVHGGGIEDTQADLPAARRPGGEFGPAGTGGTAPGTAGGAGAGVQNARYAKHG